MKEKEYDTLRQEIMQWQNRRFSIVTGSLVIVIAILGWTISTPYKWSWTTVSSILFAMLTIAGYMTWLIGLLTTRISTYIEVFHEDGSTDIGWERRHRKPIWNFISSKGAYATMFFGIAIISLTISLTVCMELPTKQNYYTFLFFSFTLAIALYLLAFAKRPWGKYISQWKAIKEIEEDPPKNSGLPSKDLPVDSTQQINANSSKILESDN